MVGTVSLPPRQAAQIRLIAAVIAPGEMHARQHLADFVCSVRRPARGSGAPSSFVTIAAGLPCNTAANNASRPRAASGPAMPQCAPDRRIRFDPENSSCRP